MDERLFWIMLEFRICGEFAGMPEKRLRRYWCDGFAPQCYLLEDPVPRITGTAWIVDDQHQQPWTFTLFLKGPASSREEIDWASHLPLDGVTCWIALDEPNKRIQIEPSAAVPDLP